MGREEIRSLAEKLREMPRIPAEHLADAVSRGSLGPNDARWAHFAADLVEAVLAAGPEPLEVVDLARVAVKPGDTLLVKPKECTDIVTADQAEEWTEYLREWLAPYHPGVRVLVLPIPADVAVLEGGESA